MLTDEDLDALIDAHTFRRECAPGGHCHPLDQYAFARALIAAHEAKQADWQRHAQRRGAELIRAAYGAQEPRAVTPQEDAFLRRAAMRSAKVVSAGAPSPIHAPGDVRGTPEASDETSNKPVTGD